MRKYFPALAIAFSLTIFIQSACAHYLYLVIDPKTGEHGSMNLYFEGGPAPGDGFYLDPFLKRGEIWFRSAGEVKYQPLELSEVKVEEKDQRWATSKLPKSGPRVVEGYGKWGVYKYGKTNVLLHYYAKFIDTETAEQLADVGQSTNLKFEVRPTWKDDTLHLEVFWDGKPAANASVYLRGPGVSENIKTDADGKALLKPEKPGQYYVRAYHQQPKMEGTFEEKPYQELRHHSSLTLHLPIGK